MILNEISMKMENVLEEDIRNKISLFLKICHLLFYEKGDRTFYYAKQLMTDSFSVCYTIHDWLKDPRVPQKEKAFFRTLINRGNLLRQEDFYGSEFFLTIENKQVSALGCLAAYEQDSFVVSFLTADLWKKEYLSGCYVSLWEEEYREGNAEVRNCSAYEHIEKIEREERNRNRLHISSGDELWEKREALYPHLIFCEQVKEQLKEARISLYVQNIMKRLQILEDYFAVYQGIFEKEKLGFGCRYESESVQNDRKLRELRRFKTPYGEEKYFYWHISFPGNFPGRIHFLPDPAHKLGIIGYIGKHLPTEKFSTI